MPELPEVEVIANDLKPVLENKVLTKFWTSNKSLRSQLSKKECQALSKQRVIKVFRRAKYLVIEFKESWLMMHFGMTGKVFVSEEKHDSFVKNNKHIHFLFKAEINNIYFQDTRRFGGIYYIQRLKDHGDLDTQVPFKLGMEPLSEGFNTKFFYTKSRGINQPIKSWLMSGFPITGVGNIYASEALFRAGIDPITKPKNLGSARSSRLVFAIKYVLIEAIRFGGSTIKDYSSIKGKPGGYSKNHLVYGKKNQICPICMEILFAKTISQRNSFYCKKCQKK